MREKMSWTRFDTRWMLSLFGTAVGAGILFLPIRAGTGGFWPVVIMALLVFPMTWLSHRGLSRFVCASSAAFWPWSELAYHRALFLCDLSYLFGLWCRDYKHI